MWRCPAAGRDWCWRRSSKPAAAGASGTWQVDAREEPAAWRITSLKTLGFIDGLHRLQLDTTRRFRATNLRVTAEDLELVLPHGSVFAADVPGGPRRSSSSAAAR